MDLVFIVGAVLAGLYFIYQGVKVQVRYAELSEFVASKKVSLPRVATHTGSIMLVGGGVLLTSVIFVPVGSLLLCSFLLLANLTVHPFWKKEERDRAIANFGLLGLLLMAAVRP